MFTAIILGAGSGTRMGLQKSKLLLEISSKTVIERSVAAFRANKRVTQIIVAVRGCDVDEFSKILEPYDVTFVIGGATRQESVKAAVSAVDNKCKYIAIHDGARPLVTAETIDRCFDTAIEMSACACGVPVKDTVKVVNKTGTIVDTPDRSTLVAIQTPQVFEKNLYLDALDDAAAKGLDFTDDCQLVERIGAKVKCVDGDYGNIKITTPEDVPMALSILKSRGE